MDRISRTSRTRRVAVAAVLATGLGASTAGVAQATTTISTLTRTGPEKKPQHRHGGVVHRAWPHKNGTKAPKNRLAKWLAHQVGPVAIDPRHVKKRKPASARTIVRRYAAAASFASTAATPLSANGKADATLLLIRSFNIPKSSPEYAGLTNYSWTYDNGLAVMAFIGAGDRDQATQLLDQLAALQNDDGSLNYAYDVSDGASSPFVRAGALAWVGLAVADYRRTYNNSRYDKMLGGIVTYLMALRTADGLVKGGPDATWVSTQHNLLTESLLRDLQSQLSGNSSTIGGYRSTDFGKLQTTMGDAIVSKLLVESGSLSYFREGIADERIPVDVQALGAMYLKLRGDGRAPAVANYLLQPAFFVPSRKTPAGTGPYSGYRPYFGAETPDLVWSEGTGEAQLALTRLGVRYPALDAGVKSLANSFTASSAGPMGADRESNDLFGEYHTWPTSAAGSWLLLGSFGTSVPLFSH